MNSSVVDVKILIESKMLSLPSRIKSSSTFIFSFRPHKLTAWIHDLLSNMKKKYIYQLNEYTHIYTQMHGIRFYAKPSRARNDKLLWCLIICIVAGFFFLSSYIYWNLKMSEATFSHNNWKCSIHYYMPDTKAYTWDNWTKK